MRIITRIPLLGPLLGQLSRLSSGKKEFSGSNKYWNDRYVAGGNSGAGSYDHLAEFKAEVINDFVAKNGVQTVIEYGCGDGNQLTIAEYPVYTGFDVSTNAVERCRELFRDDPTKSFKLVPDYQEERADLTMSLDVIYHLVEDDVFEDYIRRLFHSSDRYVIVYASNHDETLPNTPHVRHRKFTDWIAECTPEWRLIEHVPNRYPISEHPDSGSFADFYFFARQGV